MSRILILMASQTYRAEAFMQAAGRLGVDLTVGSNVEHQLLALAPDAYLPLDLRRTGRARRQIVEFARRYPLDAVVGVDDEVAILAAMAAEDLGLPHNSVESTKAARYKDVMRLILSETPLNNPEFQLVALKEDPEVAAARVRYPCVVKPLSLSASRGIIRADDPGEFVAAFQEAAEIIQEANLDMDDPGAQQILVEDFIPGREFALEGLLSDGRLTVLALFDKPDPLDGPHFEETIYVTPSRLPAPEQTAVADAVEQAARAIGLREGPLHAEVRLNQAGPWVIEIAPRSIGGLCSNSLRFDFDLSLEEIILRQAARLEVASLQRERRPSGVMMIPIPRGGILCNVHGLEAARGVPGVERVTISIPIGQPVVPVPRGNRYLGFIFAHGSTSESVEESLRAAHACLRFDIGEGS